MNPYCHSVDPFAESSPWNLSGILALSDAPRAPHPASTGAVHDQRGGWSPHGYIGRHRVENSSVDGVVSRGRWFHRIPRRVENDADNWPGRHARPTERLDVL